MTQRLLRMRQVEEKISYKRNWIYERIADGAFPKPEKVNGQNAWRESDIDAWIEKQFRTVAAEA